MNSADFISLAIKLSNSQQEVELRTAVSRAFYGAFHSVRELLEECGIAFPARELLGGKRGLALPMPATQTRCWLLESSTS
jgi:hypothetical protein